MDVILYNNTSENNSLKKNLTNSETLSGFMREPVDVLRPIFRIQTNPLGHNYCYINKFSRYYFIKDVVNIRNDLWELHCEVDVLTSYYNEIQALSCVIDKQETNGDVFIDDGSWVVENKKIIETLNFSQGFLQTPTNILITAGSMGV